MPEAVIEQHENQPPALGRIIAKNALFVTFGSFALKAVNFLFSVFVVRRLGDERFGQYSTILAFVGLFQIFAELGISQYVMREIARDRSKAAGLFWNLVAVRILLALFGIAGITIAAIEIGYSPLLVTGVLFYTVSFLLSAIEAPLETLLTANERLDYVSMLAILGQVVFVVLGGIFMISGLGFIWLIVASLLSILPQIVLSSWAVRRHHLIPGFIRLNPRSWFSMIRSGFPFGLISLALTISFSIDTVMLSRFQPDQVVGWYNVAYNLEKSLLFFFTGFSVAIVPSLSRTYMQNASEVERWYYRSVKIILLTSLPVAVGGMLVARPLIQFLYTPQFGPAALAFMIIVWDVPFLMFSSFCGNMTTVVGEERNAAWIYGAGAVVNVLLNLYAIPHYSYLGAAAVTVMTDLVDAVLFYFLLRRKLNLPNINSIVTRIVLASALMGLAVWLAGNRNLFLLVLIGAAVYSVMALVLRLLDKKEWELIQRLLKINRASQTANDIP